MDRLNAAIHFPLARPADVLEMIAFSERMNARMRKLRDEGSLPRAALTLPDEFDDLIVAIYEEIRAQAWTALEAGREVVEVRYPRGESFDALLGWMAARMDLLERIVRAGLIESRWERPFRLMVLFWNAAVAQVPVGPAARA